MNNADEIAPTGASALKKKVEELLRSHLRDPQQPSLDEVTRLAYEAELRQSDLARQNQELRKTQQELEANRDRYVELYDTAPMGYVTLDEEGSNAAPPKSMPGGPARDEKPIRVLLADDHQILREGLATLLREQPGIEVVGEAADGRQAVDLTLDVRPDVVLMDVTMPVLSGIEATRHIKAALPGATIIGLSMHEADEVATAMRDAGASAYLSKSGSPEALVEAIRQTALAES
jgi:CheY-like chemotaxis protein